MFIVIIKTTFLFFLIIFDFGTTLGEETGKVNQILEYRWSAWSQFSLCTRSCGVGVKRRHRTCYVHGTTPVPVEADLCQGPPEVYQTCNTQDCPVDSVDFRSLQCSYFEDVTHKQRKHKWIPFQTGHLSTRSTRVINPCALICSPVDTSQFAVKFSSQVVDGTPCSLDPPRSICVKGVCKPLSCDKKLNSNKVPDSCGVCGGDNRSCLPIAGSIYRNISEGYHDLLEIPKGATDINIQELADSKAVLALKSPSGIYFIIDNRNSQTKTKHIAGSRFYHRRSNSNNRLEYLKSKGPTTTSITLLGFTRKKNTEISIRYEFSLSTKRQTDNSFDSQIEQSYDWKTLLYHQMIIKNGIMGPEVSTVKLPEGIENVSKITGNGLTNSEIVTTLSPEAAEIRETEMTPNVQAGILKERGIPEFIPAQDKQNVDRLGLLIESSAQESDEVRPLEIGINVRRGSLEMSKNFYWKRNRITDCSSTCTADGTQVSFFSCYRHDGTQVDDVFCDVNTKPDPNYYKCIGSRCPPRWVVGSWNTCSGKCGNGTQTRTVRCWQMLAPGFDSTVPEYRCSESTKPVTSQNCTLTSCGPEWEMSRWSECSTMCGNGTRSRNVRCSTGADDQCDANTKPVGIQTCLQPPCTSRWFTESWTPCDGKCGVGVRKRRVGCRDKMGRQMSDSFCDENTKPLSVKACGNKLNCAPTWVPQKWEKCKSPCGENHAKRKIVCGFIVKRRFKLLSDKRCHHLPKPRMLASCTNRKCGAQWYTTQFSECSATCGENAVRMRSVKCYDGDTISESCDNKSKPPEVENCNFSPLCPNDDCEDKILNCHLLMKDLCKQTYYFTNCCKTCQKLQNESKSIL